MEERTIFCEQVLMDGFSSVLLLETGKVGKLCEVWPFASHPFPCMSLQISTRLSHRTQGYFPDLPLKTHTKSIENLLFYG